MRPYTEWPGGDTETQLRNALASGCPDIEIPAGNTCTLSTSAAVVLPRTLRHLRVAGLLHQTNTTTAARMMGRSRDSMA